MSKLLVLGDQKTVTLFSLMGAIGLRVETSEDMDYAAGYVEDNQKQIAGLLIKDSMLDYSKKLIGVANELGIPYTTLSEGGRSEGSYEITKLLGNSYSGNKKKL